MWLIAGVLLGLVVLAALLGFHAGPHVHVAAGVLGVVAAAWLIVMAVEGRSLSLLLALLAADVVVSAGVGVLAWKGFTDRGSPHPLGRRLLSSEGAEGIAQGDLDPDGVVRVNGENWSAVSLNGRIRNGTRVQVIGGGRVRLEVWGEDVEAGDDAPGLAAGTGGPTEGADVGAPVPTATEVHEERHNL